MGDYEKAAKVLKHLGHQAGFDDELDKSLRYVRVSVGAGKVVAAGTERVALVRADLAMTVVSAGFIVDTAMASDATNYRTLKLRKHDGAAGTPTLLDTKGGASTAIAADTTVAFTIDEATDTLAAGDVLEVEISDAGTGAALGNSTCYAVLRLD